MEAYQFIENNELVVNAFGCWPSFHDGEIHKLLLDSTKTNAAGDRYSSIELYLRGWIMTSEITEDGYYRLTNDNVVHFVFEQISELELEHLNHQNVISGLDLELITQEKNDESALKVELALCYGLSGSFVAKYAKIESVLPMNTQ